MILLFLLMIILFENFHGSNYAQAEHKYERRKYLSGKQNIAFHESNNYDF